VRSKLLPGALAVAMAAVPAPSGAASLEGRVSIVGKRGAALDPSRAVAWIEGEAAGLPAPIPGRVTITTRGKRFLPDIVVVPVGTTVIFPNQDAIRHNVFSSSEGNRFDLGLYGPGPGKEITLRTPGVVRVYCNVHPDMATFVIVSPTPFATRVRSDGSFELPGLPAGRHQLTVWDERGGSRTLPIEIAADGSGTAAVELDATGFKRSRHLDKDGLPYSERETQDYR
jgi:plastocyanin